MSRHKHTYDRVVLVNRVLHLRCGECRHVDPEPATAHNWTRPGRPLAHGRVVECSSCRVTLPATVLHVCSRCGPVPHRLKIRTRGGLGVSCARCGRLDARQREIHVEVSRGASRRYQARLRMSRKLGLVF